MTESISTNSTTINTSIDQDNHPITKDESMSKVLPPEFKDLIAQYHQIKEKLDNQIEKLAFKGLIAQHHQIEEEIDNQIKKLAQSRQNHQTQLTAPDIKSSAAFQEFLTKQNLSEKEGLDLLKKIEEKIQQYIKA